MTTLNSVPNRALALMQRAVAAIAVIASMALATTAYAGEGHDHGDAAPVATGAGSPRERYDG